MIFYLIFAGLILAAPFTGLLPVVRAGDAPHNTIFGVTMPRRADWRWPTQSWAGVLAQEIAEWWLRWAGALLACAPLAWLIGQQGDVRLWLALLPALMFAGLWTRLPGLWRQFELLGHAVEVVIAEEREDRADYLMPEALSMLAGSAEYYAGEFDSMTAIEIAEALDARRGMARVLITLLGRSVRRT